MKLIIKILSIILTITISSCIELPQTIPTGETFQVTSAYSGNGINTFYTYIIDSCEYIGNAALTSNTAILTHKGNCKYCLQRLQHK